MRIGLVTGEYPPSIGGVGDHTARLASELANAGHAVEVLTSGGDVEAEDPRVAILPLISRWDMQVLAHVPAIARLRRWDVLHVQYQPAMYQLRGEINFLPWIVRARGRPRPAVVTTFHDLRVPYLFPKAGPLRTLAVRALATGSDAAVAVADSDLPQLLAWRRGRPAETTQHVPLGDQLSAPLPAGFERTEWRARLPFPPEAPLIGYFGLINQSKGVRELAEALARLPDAHLVMLGEQVGGADATNVAYLRGVKALIRERGLSDRVHWTGHLAAPALCAWLRSVDVVSLPFLDGASLRRTSLIAAWAQGAPVITTRPVGPASWATESPPPARFVPAGDVDALAEAVRDLVQNPAERERLASAGRKLADQFAWPEVVRQTLDVYHAALEVSGA